MDEKLINTNFWESCLEGIAREWCDFAATQYEDEHD